MTIFTGTPEELELWLAERDALADAQIAAGEFRPLQEWIDQWKLTEVEQEDIVAEYRHDRAIDSVVTGGSLDDPE